MSTWPEAHYLSPLHPCLEWASDRALESLGRNQVFAVASEAVAGAAVLLHGTLTNQRGQVVASTYVVVRFPEPKDPSYHLPQPFGTLREALADLGLTGEAVNTGALQGRTGLEAYVGPGVRAGRRMLDQLFSAATDSVVERVQEWSERVSQWDAEAVSQVQRQEVKVRRSLVDEEKEIADAMLPDQKTIRPLLLVVPADGGEA
jgi:hypothetical protein